VLELAEEPLQLRVYSLQRSSAGSQVSLASELEDVVPLIVVEAQGAAQGGEDRCRGPDPALFDAGVVIRADGGEMGDLGPAQPRHAAQCRVVGQPDGTRTQLGPPSFEELAQLVQVCLTIHDVSLTAGLIDVKGESCRARRRAITPQNRTSKPGLNVYASAFNFRSRTGHCMPFEPLP
jgi:hypothetical protein